MTSSFPNINGKTIFGIKKWESYKHLFTRIQIPARNILLREGEISRQAYFIEKGCLRVWFLNNGKDVTFQFFLENETVSSIESLSKDIPSAVTIETIEPCILWKIQKKDLTNVIEQSIAIPELRETFTNAIFQRTFHYMRQFMSSLKDTPLQRYINLMKDKPLIVKRVPQHYIASYLGITTVHLSRIKNKLKPKSRI
jgi:CRP-like cAMP-binding protein